MNRQITKGDADLMMDAGVFMSAIAGLISDNISEECSDGNPFLNAYRLDGLMKGLAIAGSQLCGRSETLTELVEEDEAEEEKKALAARQRCQGQDKPVQSNVEAECGTQRAA